MLRFKIKKDPQVDFICTREGVETTMPIIPAREYEHQWLRRAAKDFKNQGSTSNPNRDRTNKGDGDKNDMSKFLVLDEGQDIRHTAKCPGIFSLKNKGWILRAHCEFKIQILNDGAGYNWSSPLGGIGWIPGDERDSGLISHHPEQNLYDFMENWPQNSMQKIFKFNMPWFARIPQGYELLCVHPFYLDDWRFTCLPGIFDSDYGLAGMALPILWHDTKGEHTIKKGTPLAQLILMPKDEKYTHTNVCTRDSDKARKEVNLTNLKMREEFNQNYPKIKKWWQNYWTNDK